MPGDQRVEQDVESYGSIRSTTRWMPKRNAVPWLRYVCASLAVIIHVCFIALIAWVSCSFAHWDTLDEPWSEPIQLRIVANRHSGLAECWSPGPLLNQGRFLAIGTDPGYCEMRASSISSNRFRSFIALTLGPLVVIQTVLHWFQGTHFPLTAARSFFIVSTGREMEWKLPTVDVVSLLTMMAMAVFFFYCGMWCCVLLYMKVHDDGLRHASTFVQLLLCLLGMLSKLKSSLIFVVMYLIHCCIISYVDPLVVAFIPVVLLFVVVLTPTIRGTGIGETNGLFATMKQVLLDLASAVFEYA
ncbi:unnamed protein product [Symbiodinium pilosum]|uniref:Uncharacterized protein n=1 Tax=Symbiodinium pilosum TaxID=2952 RepID=A0A812WEC4_SYMPI|nr:unnamed protein product [Symbiodinium pilosum]